MDRRKFFKATGVALGGSSICRANTKTLDLPLIPSYKWKVDEKFKVTDVFEQTLFNVGCEIVYPLDLIPPVKKLSDKVYINVAFCRPEKAYESIDEVCLPMYDVGSIAEKSDEAIKNLDNKIRLDAANLLFRAGVANNKYIVAKSRNLIEYAIAEKFSKLYSFSFGDYIIGVNVKNKDYFVMPVREEPVVYENILEYWTWTEYGLGVLDNSKLLIGKVQK